MTCLAGATPGTPGAGAADALQQADAPAAGAAPTASVHGARCLAACERRHFCPSSRCSPWWGSLASTAGHTVWHSGCSHCCGRQAAGVVAAPAAGHPAAHDRLARAPACPAAAAGPAACHTVHDFCDAMVLRGRQVCTVDTKLKSASASSSMRVTGQWPTCGRCTRGRGRPVLAAGSCGGSCGGRDRRTPTAGSATPPECLHTQTPALPASMQNSDNPDACGVAHSLTDWHQHSARRAVVKHHPGSSMRCPLYKCGVVRSHPPSCRHARRQRRRGGAVVRPQLMAPAAPHPVASGCAFCLRLPRLPRGGPCRRPRPPPPCRRRPRCHDCRPDGTAPSARRARCRRPAPRGSRPPHATAALTFALTHSRRVPVARAWRFRTGADIAPAIPLSTLALGATVLEATYKMNSRLQGCAPLGRRATMCWLSDKWQRHCRWAIPQRPSCGCGGEPLQKQLPRLLQGRRPDAPQDQPGALACNACIALACSVRVATACN